MQYLYKLKANKFSIKINKKKTLVEQTEILQNFLCCLCATKCSRNHKNKNKQKTNVKALT